jgi:hypothetical protein
MDLDGRFIFLWIAFNSLYGQAKYRLRGPGRGPEERDIETFLGLVVRLDRDGRVDRELRAVRGAAEELIADPFLDDDCWMRWDAEGIRDFDRRRETAIRRDDPRPTLRQVFRRLYVLRREVFHGCATAKGSRNRQALKRAVGVLERLFPAIEEIVRNNGGGYHSCGGPVSSVGQGERLESGEGESRLVAPVSEGGRYGEG